jgi:hypothetical protein
MATQSVRISGTTDAQGREVAVTLEYDDVTNVATLVRCVNNTDDAILVTATKTDPATGEELAGQTYSKVFAPQATDVVNFPQNGPNRIFITFRAPGKLLGYVIRTVYPAP